MKAMVIGGAGFVGNYLIEHLSKDCKYQVIATKLENENIKNNNCVKCDLNILNKNEIIDVLKKYNPDQIYHLAAQSSVKLSWEKPQLTVDININGTINLLEAIKETGLSSKILLVGSGEEYGHIKEIETPIKEENPLRSGNIYAATKVCQGLIGSIYAKAYFMDIIIVRAFNHIGAGQLPMFVVSDFCKQVVEIEKGLKEPTLKVGNLSAKRDFTDVRDVVRAYSLLMQKGKSGEIYNVGSGKAISIRSILDIIISISKLNIDVIVDKEKLRPVDVPIIEADITKIQSETGWAPTIEIEKTIIENLEYWRQNI